MKEKNKGFTLLELLVVIAIIGLLSTFAVVSLNSGREKARDSRRLSDMKQLQMTMEFHFDAGDTYAMTDTDCDSISFPVTNAEVSSCGDLATYMPNIAQLNDPSDAGDICPDSASSPTINDLGCNYSFSAAPDANGYSVKFYLETATSVGNSGASLCTMTEDGITCP